MPNEFVQLNAKVSIALRDKIKVRAILEGKKMEELAGEMLKQAMENWDADKAVKQVFA